jgi:hypothetical protein
MALMATPWKHPTTGFYYLRRQIPGKMRPAFGGKALWKVSLNTKSAAEANILFLQANAALEQQFEEIRVRIKATGEPLPSQRDRASDMIAAYFQGPERDAGGLDGTERLLLARLEIDRGLWNMTPTGCSPVAASSIDQWWALANNAAMFRDHGGTRRPPQGHTPGSIWRWSDDSFQPRAKAKQIERLLEQVARHHDMERRDLPAPIADAAIAYLNSTPIEVSNTRKRRTVTGRLRPDLRLMELFDSWKLAMQPTLQTAHEYEGAARDFVDFLGDIPVEDIEQNDLLDYRDEARHLPSTMPKADRALPSLPNSRYRRRAPDRAVPRRHDPRKGPERGGSCRALTGRSAECTGAVWIAPAEAALFLGRW